MRASWASAVCGTLAAVSLCAQTQPTFYAAYADGLEAAKQGQWRAAAEAFKRALSLRPESSARIFIYGNNLLNDYYPYSHLSRCYLELGDLDAAARTLRQAEGRGEPAALRLPLAQRLAPVPPLPRPVPVPAILRPVPVPVRPPSNPVLDPAPLVPAAPAPTPLGEFATVTSPSPPTPEAARKDPSPGPPLAAPVGEVEVAAPPRLADPQPAPATVPPQAPLQVPQAESIRPISSATWGLAAGLLASLALLAWTVCRPRAAGGGPGRAALQPSTEPESIGPYQILRRLGYGGFATTYLAHHLDTGQEVALKVLHPHRLLDPEFTRRFAQEARLGALLDHPSLVRLLDPGPAESKGWIALEYVAGPTLAERLREQGGPLPLAEAIETALTIAKAMAYAHAHGVIHRDLKPGNIILGEDGPKVMDLGIAREMDSQAVTTTYAFMGTPLYAAPEAQLVAQAGPAADRYSLGVILYEMLAGAPPYAGKTPFAILEQHRQAPVPDITEIRPVAPELARLLGRMLAKDPEKRPEDGELVAKLERLRESCGGLEPDTKGKDS